MSYDSPRILNPSGGGAFTFATLPAGAATATIPPGTQAYTSDAGTSVWGGAAWGVLGSPQSFIPQTLNNAGILAAAVAAQAAGGGVVQLPAATITLTASLPLLPGVTYNGAGFTVTGQGSPTLTGGTILKGDGTFPLFAGNATDLGVPYSSSAALISNWISGCGVSSMGLQNGSYGIKCGALYQAGAQYGNFHDLFIQGCSVNAAWFENFAQCSFDRISVYGNFQGGQFMGSGQALWNFGNSHFQKLTGGASTANGSGRVWSFQARVASELNNLSIFDIGGSGAAVTNTQAATMVSTSTAIGVTDLSQYAVGMPVNFSATANGFTGTQIYFVLSVSGTSGAGSITVGNFMGGTGGSTAIAATGSTAVNILTKGWPVLEVGGSDTGSTITYSSIKGASDIEVGGTAHIVLQALSGFDGEFGIIHAGSSTCDICVRNVVGQGVRLNLQNIGAVLDLDSSAQKITVNGADGTYTNTNFAGVGITTSGSSGFGQIRLKGASTADVICNANFFNQIQMQNSFALLHSQQASGTTLATANGNLITFTTAAGGTLTLPSLTSVNFAGWEYRVSNPQANAVTISAAQNIVGQGASAASISLAALSNAIFVAHNNAGTMYWARYV